MKFNPQLKQALQNYEQASTNKAFPSPPEIRKENTEQTLSRVRIGPIEKVVGGDILWKPIDRTAALMLIKAPWWAQPVYTPPKPPPKPEPKQKRKRHHMSKLGIKESDGFQEVSPFTPGGDYTSSSGIRIKMVNGEPMLSMEDVHRVICDEIARMPKEELGPMVKTAKDARATVDELLEGIGGDMDKFKANSKHYLEDIRQTRFSVVSETAAMTKELKDVRQFFLGSDYKEQIERLREFVDLCERLQKLKQSGFLDSVADTMIRLAD